MPINKQWKERHAGSSEKLWRWPELRPKIWKGRGRSEPRCHQSEPEVCGSRLHHPGEMEKDPPVMRSRAVDAQVLPTHTFPLLSQRSAASAGLIGRLGARAR